MRLALTRHEYALARSTSNTTEMRGQFISYRMTAALASAPGLATSTSLHRMFSAA